MCEVKKHPYLKLDEGKHQWIVKNGYGLDAVYGECGECSSDGDYEMYACDVDQRLKSFREGNQLLKNICFRCFVRAGSDNDY